MDLHGIRKPASVAANPVSRRPRPRLLRGRCWRREARCAAGFWCGAGLEFWRRTSPVGWKSAIRGPIHWPGARFFASLFLDGLHALARRDRWALSVLFRTWAFPLSAWRCAFATASDLFVDGARPHQCSPIFLLMQAWLPADPPRPSARPWCYSARKR